MLGCVMLKHIDHGPPYTEKHANIHTCVRKAYKIQRELRLQVGRVDVRSLATRMSAGTSPRRGAGRRRSGRGPRPEFVGSKAASHGTLALWDRYFVRVFMALYLLCVQKNITAFPFRHPLLQMRESGHSDIYTSSKFYAGN